MIKIKLAIMQPYFLPYIGYWQLINSADVFVIYDDVAYIKGGWINRNRLLENNIAKAFTLPLREVSQNRNINEILIESDLKKLNKLKKRIQHNYSKAPYFNETSLLIDKILDYDCKNIAELNQYTILTISKYLDIKTNVLLSSEIEKNNSLSGQNKIIHICSLLGAKTYINPISGTDLYNRMDFAARDVKLNFLKTNHIEYKQFNHPFVPNLSILDVMMFNSVEQIQLMLEEYTLLSL